MLALCLGIAQFWFSQCLRRTYVPNFIFLLKSVWETAKRTSSPLFATHRANLPKPRCIGCLRRKRQKLRSKFTKPLWVTRFCFFLIHVKMSFIPSISDVYAEAGTFMTNFKIPAQTVGTVHTQKTLSTLNLYITTSLAENSKSNV